MTPLKSHPWLACVEVRMPQMGDWCINMVGIAEHFNRHFGARPIVIPCNDYRVYRLEDITIPDGWEPDGETLLDAWRGTTASGKPYVNPFGGISNDGCADNSYRMFIRPVKPKTKRVLVAEMYNPTESQVNAFRAVAENFPSLNIRIEERP